MQTDLISHPKNAARFIETVRARAPRGFADALKQAARADGLTASEFVRRAVAGAIRERKEAIAANAGGSQ